MKSPMCTINRLLVTSLLVLAAGVWPTQAACPYEFKCLNYGSFNQETCACDCFPSYSSQYCEKAECPNEPVQCEASLGKQACQDEALKFYCPKMCGLSSCECGYGECLNGGTFDQATCSCSCPLPFSGKVCQDCQADFEQCGSVWKSEVCVKDQIFSKLCPRLCKYQNCHLISPAPSGKKCPFNKQCYNHGTLNKTTCECECLPNYEGEFCETLFCPAEHHDPSLCDSISVVHCWVDLVFNYCPFKCGKCSLRPKTPQPTTSTAETTKLECVAKNCKYSFGFDDEVECKCICDKEGFSGELCEKFDCQNPVKDDEFYCDSEVDCSDEYDVSICPKMCLCKQA